MIPTDAEIFDFFSGHGMVTAFFIGAIFGAFPGYLKGIWQRIKEIKKSRGNGND